MAEEQKKPKIDLRARLKKKAVGTAGGASIPPPMTTGTSIPAPAFPSKPAPPVEEPRRAEPHAIKIEMSEEVVQAQKKGRTKVILIAVATAVVGAGLGVVLGDGMARRERQEIALQGAEILADDVDKANVVIDEMAETLASAKRTLSDGEFPEKEVQKLGGLTIPFDGTYLVGKGTGLMSADVNRLLVDFAANSQAANEQKDALQNVLNANKSALKEVLDAQENPKVNWSVVMVNGPYGPMASMQPVPEPFLLSSKEKVEKDGKKVDYSWPEQIKVPNGDQEISLAQYKRGEPLGGDPMYVPVDPSTQNAVCPSDTLFKLRREISNLEKLLRGDTSDPTNEKAGLMDMGQTLIDQLKGIGH